MRIYFGIRVDGKCHVYSWDAGKPERPEPLPLRQDLWNHSPDGPEWGYSGSGPAQLALALAADVLGEDERAVAVHQQLKFALITGLEKPCWSLTHERIINTIVRLETDRARRERSYGKDC